MDFKTLTHDGRSFRLADEGSGQPVVLLHGFPDGPASWETTAAVLHDAGFRTIVPFLRGYHPDTVVSGRGYSRAEIGGDVIDLLDAVDVESAVVVGHDWGASCAWSAAALAPERLDGIVPIGVPHPAALKPSPGLVLAVRHFGYFKAPFSDQRTRRNDFAYIDTLYERWAPDWDRAERAEAIARAKTAFANPVVLHEALNWYRDLSLKPDKANNFTVECPGLVVAGGADFGGDLTAYHGSVERFAGAADLLVVEGAGHWPHREGQARFDEALVGFLRGL